MKSDLNKQSITAVFFAPLIHRVLHILHIEDQSES